MVDPSGDYWRRVASADYLQYYSEVTTYTPGELSMSLHWLVTWTQMLRKYSQFRIPDICHGWTKLLEACNASGINCCKTYGSMYYWNNPFICELACFIFGIACTDDFLIIFEIRQRYLHAKNPLLSADVSFPESVKNQSEQLLSELYLHRLPWEAKSARG